MYKLLKIKLFFRYSYFAVETQLEYYLKSVVFRVVRLVSVKVDTIDDVNKNA